MVFMTMLLILPPNSEISQHAWEPILMYQRLTALTERPQSAMVKELMESQMSAALHHFHNAMVFQEPTDIQELIALPHHSQHVVLLTVDFQEETAL